MIRRSEKVEVESVANGGKMWRSSEWVGGCGEVEVVELEWVPVHVHALARRLTRLTNCNRRQWRLMEHGQHYQESNKRVHPSSSLPHPSTSKASSIDLHAQ